MASGVIKRPTGIAQLTNITASLTAATGVSLRNATIEKNEAVAVINVQFDVTTALSNGALMISGFPVKPLGDVYVVAGGAGGYGEVTFKNDYTMIAGGTGFTTGAWFSVSVTYPI